MKKLILIIFVLLFGDYSTHTIYSNVTVIHKRAIEIPKPHIKGFNEYKKAIRNIETKGYSDTASYYAKSPSGKHWGRYQLGKIARTVAGYPDITYDEFACNYQLQEESFKKWITYLRKEMKPYVIKYSGKTIDGIILTESGIISMAHNVGGPQTRKYLDRGYNPPGPLKFLKLNEYNLDIN